DLDYAVYGLLSPMLYLLLWKHSAGACTPRTLTLEPECFIATQVDLLLHGLCLRGPAHGPGPARAPSPLSPPL
ncbi:MAG: TetR/AcrR family transcriptional regulator, partial [Burkholderiaceae bacterium]|nr:TetR/AcrR family transcriptional regulator [Burkholderiaceae bacterium]